MTAAPSNRQTLMIIVVMLVLVFFTSVPDHASNFFSDTLPAFFDHETKSSTFVKGIVFMVVPPSLNPEQHDDDDDESAATRSQKNNKFRFPPSSLPFPEQLEICIRHVAEHLLPEILVRDQPQAMHLIKTLIYSSPSSPAQHATKKDQDKYVKKTLSSSSSSSSALARRKLLDAIPTDDALAPLLPLADIQHEQWVVRSWMSLEKEFASRDAKVVRAVGACLRGGGLGLDKPHSEEHWALRGGKRNEHPFFFPLHGAVSPRRVIQHSLRTAEYMGVATSALKAADNSALSAMRMPGFLDFVPYSISGSAAGAGGGIRAVMASSASVGALKKLAGLVGFWGDDDGNNNNIHSHHSSSEKQSSRERDTASQLLLKEPTDDDLVQTVTPDEESQMQQHEMDETGSRVLVDLVDAATAADSRAATKVIVDLGCGHAAMLGALCPPHPRLWCYGVDFTEALINKGLRAFPHIDLRHGISAPHLPTGSADAVLSNGVAGVIRFSHNCEHFAEILRLLKPNKGVGVVWHLSTTRWARFHPSFFGFDEEFYLGEEAAQRSFVPKWKSVAVDPATTAYDEAMSGADSGRLLRTFNASSRNSQTRTGSSSSSNNNNNIFSFRKLRADKILSRCPNKLWRYLSRVDIIADDPHIPLYTPKWDEQGAGDSIKTWPGTFGVRMFRNGVKFISRDILAQRKEKDEAFRDRRQFARHDALSVITSFGIIGTSQSAAASTSAISPEISNNNNSAATKKRGRRSVGSSSPSSPASTWQRPQKKGLDADVFALAQQVNDVLSEYDRIKQRQRNNNNNNGKDKDNSHHLKKWPTVLRPPEGLRILMMQHNNNNNKKRGRSDDDTSSISSRRNVNSNNLILRKERRKYRQTLDLAMKCVVFDKKSKTWCPDGRALLPED